MPAGRPNRPLFDLIPEEAGEARRRAAISPVPVNPAVEIKPSSRTGHRPDQPPAGSTLVAPGPRTHPHPPPTPPPNPPSTSDKGPAITPPAAQTPKSSQLPDNKTETADQTPTSNQPGGTDTGLPPANHTDSGPVIAFSGSYDADPRSPGDNYMVLA